MVRKVSVGAGGRAKTKASEIPLKLRYWDNFFGNTSVEPILMKSFDISDIFKKENILSGALWNISVRLIDLQKSIGDSYYSLMDIVGNCFLIWYKLILKKEGNPAYLRNEEWYKDWFVFLENVKAVVLQGTDKYAGSTKDKKENIDIQPRLFGQEAFSSFVIGDMSKRVFRLYNQLRDRDLFKMSLWCYLYYTKRVIKKKN